METKTEILRMFYNADGIGDVLLVRMCDAEVASTVQKQDLWVLYDKAGERIGFNLFQASSHVSCAQKNGYFQDAECLRQLEAYACSVKEEIKADSTSYFVVGEIVAMQAHPNSEKLHVCTVDLKEKTVSIVCKSVNAAVGVRCVAALPNAVLPNGLLIVPAKVMEVHSYGMLCSARELGIAPQDGLLLLLDSHYTVGEPFIWKG